VLCCVCESYVINVDNINVDNINNVIDHCSDINRTQFYAIANVTKYNSDVISTCRRSMSVEIWTYLVYVQGE